MNDNTFLDIFQ